MTQFTTLCHSEQRYTAYYGTFAHTPKLGNLEVLPNTLLGVDQNGIIDFIISVEPPIEIENLKSLVINNSSIKLSPNNIDIISIVDNVNSFFFPGFIDTHIHAPQLPNNGILGN